MLNKPHDIPAELKKYRQFICWRTVNINGKIKKIPINPLNQQSASVTNPYTWSSYDQAITACQQVSDLGGIGFVLSNQDPFTFIDLDIPHNNEERAVQLRIAEAFNSYSEISPSGSGLHIIVKGNLPAGVRRGSIEMYSSARFMTLTGNVYKPLPIMDVAVAQPLLDILYDEMTAGRVNVHAVMSNDHETSYDIPATLPPTFAEECAKVWQTAANASNGALFCNLWEGKWQQRYPSQSEADFALIDILAHYTKNKTVIIGLYRQSALGQRTKAQRKDYVARMLARAFDNQAAPVLLTGMPTVGAAVQVIPRKEAPAPIAQGAGLIPPVGISDNLYPEIAIKDLPSPTGLVAEIASYLYTSSRIQNAEFALAGSLAFMAGICGRSYNVSKTGLNLYMMLIARTGRGKDGVKTGINRIINKLASGDESFRLSQRDAIVVPTITDYFSGARFASGQGMLKLIAEKPSLLVMRDEFAQELERYASKNATMSDRLIRDVLLEAFSASGHGNFLDGSVYSDKAKNTPTVYSPALSLLGLSTPERIFDRITPSDIASGFMPRFIFIEVKERVEYVNEKPDETLAAAVAERIYNIVEMANSHKAGVNTFNGNSQAKSILPTEVTLTEEAEKLSRQYMYWCLARVQDSDTGESELWNRAHLNALRIAALIAVGNRHIAPCITADNINWAINFVNACVRNIINKFAENNGGLNDNIIGGPTAKCKKYIEQLIDQYADVNEAIPTAKLNAPLREVNILPYGYLSYHAFRNKYFRAVNDGDIRLSTLLRAIIIDLEDSGRIVEIKAFDDREQIKERFGTINGKLYKII